MTNKKKFSTRKKKTAKLILALDKESGHNILIPLNTILKNPNRFTMITKEE